MKIRTGFAVQPRHRVLRIPPLYGSHQLVNAPHDQRNDGLVNVLHGQFKELFVAAECSCQPKKGQVVRTCILEPGLPRSTGDGPASSPPF